MPNTIHEVAVYLHGVQPGEEVGPHMAEYQALHSRIRKHRKQFPPRFIATEWGWELGPDLAKGQEQLTRAQQWLGQRVMSQFLLPSDFTLNPLRAAVNGLRSLMFYGFGDMFYYVSADGKSSVRYAVAAQIVRQLVAEFGSLEQLKGRRLSLTLLGHSAGSVIAFDLLFHLFYPHSDVKKSGKATGRQHTFIEEQRVKAGVDENIVDELEALRELAQSGRLRLRRLYTFGSPLAMLALRSHQVLDLYAAGRGVDPAYHGFVQNPAGFGTALLPPRWINIWDRDDPIAWPNTALIANDDGEGRKVARDEYIDVSDSVRDAHGKYWTSDNVARAIARSW